MPNVFGRRSRMSKISAPASHSLRDRHWIRRAFRLARDTAFIAMGKYGQYFVTLVTVPLCARILGVNGTGQLALGMSAFFFGSVLVDFGLSQMLAARFSQSRIDSSTRRNFLFLRSVGLTPLALATILSFTLAPGSLTATITLGALVGGVSSIGEEWALIGMGRFGRIAIFQTIARLLYLISLVILLPLARSPITVLACLGVSSIVGIILSWGSVGAFSRGPIDRVEVAALLRLGSPAVGARILTSVYGQGASFVLATVASVQTIGLFSSGDKIVKAVQSALDAIGVALLPRLARQSGGANFWKSARQGAALAVLVGTVCAGLIIFLAPVAIPFIYGGEFRGAIVFLQVQSLGLPAACAVSTITTSVLFVKEDALGVLMCAVAGVVGAGAGVVAGLLEQNFWFVIFGILFGEWFAFALALMRMRHIRRRQSSSDLWQGSTV